MLSVLLRTGLLACALAAAACEFDGSGFGSGGEDADGDRTGADATVDGGATLDTIQAMLPDAALDAAPPDAAAPTEGCPASYTYDRYTASSYRTSFLPRDWYGAEADCADDGVGTHLVVIEGDHELGRITQQLGSLQVWVGLTDTKQEDVFVWVTGEDAWFLPWKSGEPNDSGPFGEDCVELSSGEYNDEPCQSTLQRYLCECDGWTPDPDAWQ